MKLILDFLPIVVFFLAYKFAPELVQALQPILSAEQHQALTTMQPIVLATAFLIPATILQILYIRLSTGKFENMHLVTLALVVVMGGATVILQDKTFIQWKPTVVNWLFAAAFMGTWLITGKTLLERMMSQNLTLPAHVWVQLNHAWTVFFVASGIANLVVAYHFSEETWVNFKLFGLLGLTIVFVLAQSVFLYRYINHDNEESR
jgi:intracellular septation protein